MEEREPGAAVKATRLVEMSSSCFHGMDFSCHPANVPNELAGKGSNVNWAFEQFCKRFSGVINQKTVIVTIMDGRFSSDAVMSVGLLTIVVADTHLSARYFGQVAQHHLASVDTRDETMYVPPLVFDRNLHDVPLPVRTADIMWAGAGISNMTAASSGANVCIPTSVYSLPLVLAKKVGGWDTDCTAIGEDMHMFLKCFFALSGHLKTQVVYAAASQCNVSSNSTGVGGVFRGLEARYSQALRHMWGSLDTGFAIRQFAGLLTQRRRARFDARVGKGISRSKSRSPTHNNRAKESQGHPTMHKLNMFIVFERLFEAHFLPTHLVLVLLTAEWHTFFHPEFPLPATIRATLNICSLSRWLSFLLVLAYFYRYDQYHRRCVELRKKEMRVAGLLHQLDEHDGFTPTSLLGGGLLGAALFPVGGVLFGALPALQAVICHVFTERLMYVVSLKPRFKQ